MLVSTRNKGPSLTCEISFYEFRTIDLFVDFYRDKLGLRSPWYKLEKMKAAIILVP